MTDPDMAGTLLPVPRAVRPSDLAGVYIEPPMSVLDRRSGRWQKRARQWKELGIQSEIGRPADLVHPRTDYLKITSDASKAGTSVFDPVLTEIIIKWFSREGDRIIDPWAGGSVRGVVSSALGRWYYGVDLSAEQVEANRAQAHLGSDIEPVWIVGDSTQIDHVLGAGTEADLIVACPPYGDLEKYSNNPRDLSNMPWGEFVEAYRETIGRTVGLLRPDRYVAIVVSDIRDKAGYYRGLPVETFHALVDAGCRVIADIVITDPLGSKQMVAARGFEAARTVQRVHQSLIVAVKGDRHRAAARLREEAAS